MPWCPKCRSEYKEGFTKCSDCNVDLVEKPEGNPNDEGFDDKRLLITANDEFEAEIVTSLLESNGIQTIKISRGDGDFQKVYMGMNTAGTDIYVWEKDYGFAQQLLEARIDELIEDVGNGEDYPGEDDDILPDINDEAEELKGEDSTERENNLILKITAWVLIILFVLFVYWYLW